MIENVTEYQTNLLKDFIKFSIKKRQKITLVCSIIIIICSILDFLLEEYIMGAIFASLGIFFLIISLSLVPLSVKKATSMPNIVNNYQFYPDQLIVSTFSKGTDMGSTTIPYSRIEKVVENKECLYLYLNKVQALLVDTKNFKEITDKEVVKVYISNNQTNKK